MTRQVPPDVLADRYATDQMIDIWSPQNKTRLLRDLWIADLRIRLQLGIDTRIARLRPLALAGQEREEHTVGILAAARPAAEGHGPELGGAALGALQPIAEVARLDVHLESDLDHHLLERLHDALVEGG